MGTATEQIIRCPRCGAANRVPEDKLRSGKQPICGRCKTALLGVGEVTDATFARDVEQSEVPVLVDMWAPWCGPCRFLSPIVEQLATELAGRVRVMKMNVDENPATSMRFQIQSIPALLLFRGGREVDRMVGAQPKSAILSRLHQIL